jgi:hypothetical protein
VGDPCICAASCQQVGPRCCGSDWRCRCIISLTCSRHLLATPWAEISLYRHGHGVGRTVPLARSLDPYGIRFLGFMNAGTPQLSAMYRLSLPSARSRVSWCGCRVVRHGTQVETTYAWPLEIRSGIARRQFQFEMGFSFG